MKNKQGFTLFELITTISILSVLTVIAIPQFLQWRSKYHLRNAVTELYSNFQLARITAIRSGVNCAITFYPDGYVVYEDSGISHLELEPGERVLARVNFKNYPGVEYDLSKGRGTGVTFFKNDDGFPSVAYRPNGLTRNNTGGFGAGSVYLTNQQRDRVYRIVMSSVGNLRVE